MPVTLSTWRTPMERSLDPEATEAPAWSSGALAYLTSTANPKRIAGLPAMGWSKCHRGGFARDLRESWDFLTVPSLVSGREVTIAHRVPAESLQFRQPRDGYMPDVRPEVGERWAIGPDERGLGTFWWRWGDLDGDLQGKKFKNDDWFDYRTHREESTTGPEWLDSEGGNGFGLTMHIENLAEVTFSDIR